MKLYQWKFKPQDWGIRIARAQVDDGDIVWMFQLGPFTFDMRFWQEKTYGPVILLGYRCNCGAALIMEAEGDSLFVNCFDGCDKAMASIDSDVFAEDLISGKIKTENYMRELT